MSTVKTTRKRILSLLLPVLAVAVLLVFVSSLSDLSKDKALEDKKQLEAALTRAAVACYACEGTYPPDISYLVEHYGIQIDESRFVVKYDIFASNLMPDITVLDIAP